MRTQNGRFLSGHASMFDPLCSPKSGHFVPSGFPEKADLFPSGYSICPPLCVHPGRRRARLCEEICKRRNAAGAFAVAPFWEASTAVELGRSLVYGVDAGREGHGS